MGRGRPYRQKICGIYKITSPSGRVYIGQSIDIVERWNSYKRLTCKGQVILHNSFLKYGLGNHVFEVICECERSELNFLEIYYEQLYDSTNLKKGMNLRGCGNVGKHSEETRRKMSISQRGKKMSEEAKMKISKSHIGMKHSKETVEKIRQLKKGNTYSVGRPVSKETRQKLRDINLGKKYSAETKLKVSNAGKGRFVSLESREKSRQSNLGKKRSDEARKNISIAHMGIKQSPELIAKRAFATRKILLNLNTGIFYYGMQEAADTIGMRKGTFQQKMKGRLKNNTPFIRV